MTKAWRRINIVGDISRSNTIPSSLSLTAGEQIFVSPNVEIGPGFILETGIENVNNCGSPRLPYTTAQLETYCTTDYRANQLSNQGLQLARRTIGPGTNRMGEGESSSSFVVEAIPNPFTDETQISYSLPAESPVTIAVYDLQGKEVLRLMDGKMQREGEHRLKINGNELMPGYYLVRVSTPTLQQTIKLSKL